MDVIIKVVHVATSTSYRVFVISQVSTCCCIICDLTPSPIPPWLLHNPSILQVRYNCSRVVGLIGRKPEQSIVTLTTILAQHNLAAKRLYTLRLLFLKRQHLPWKPVCKYVGQDQALDKTHTERRLTSKWAMNLKSPGVTQHRTRVLSTATYSFRNYSCIAVSCSASSIDVA